MPLEIHSFVKDSDDFHAIFYENVENQAAFGVAFFSRGFVDSGS